ncbi:MAG: iron-sulfur cluster repair di-iron protein [Saprospiraceae bacterium]|nr:iron-sulfur cluster repair di-iron protein [Saprospiraceae bacterium]
MITLDLSTPATVGSFVARDYRTAAVFQKYGIDFCCKGGKLLSEVCKNKNINENELLRELEDASKQTEGQPLDFQSWPPDLLIDYIEKKHHRFVEQMIETLPPFLDKLCKVHGARHPELFKITQEFKATADALSHHMQKEEMILFPFIRKMVYARQHQLIAERPPFGSVENPIQMMQSEHDQEGERFRKISEWTNAYTPPADACTTYRVAFAMLKEFEEDLHMHIHLENNILFPKALTMESELEC